MKFMKDVFNIVTAGLPIEQRFRLLAGLLCAATGSHRLLGWRINYAGRSNLILLYSEIFARQGYRFASTTSRPVIFDCGANIGMATLYFKWLYSNARITAIEPDPAAFNLLENNLTRNGLKDTTAFNFALGATQGEVDLFVPHPGSLMTSNFASRANGEAIRVPVRRLSELISEPVDLLKLDIEGMEGPVLQELAQSGKMSLVRQAIIEVHHNLPDCGFTLGRILELLEASGFQYHVLNSYSASADTSSIQDIVIHAART